MSASSIDWLLEEDNPPVRYLTLRDLAGASAPALAKARARLMEYEVTQKILKHGDEFWDEPGKAYDKYRGSYWQLIFLGQFLADGKDKRIAGGAGRILDDRKWRIEGSGQCLTANVLAALTRLGYGGHPTVQAERERLAEQIVRDRGIDCPAMAYSLLPGCYMAQPKLLLCFSQVPAQERSVAVQSAIKLLVENLLAHQIHMYVPGNQQAWLAVLASNPGRAGLPAGQTVKQWISDQREAFLAKRGAGDPRAKAGWLKFGFPLHYNSDILEAAYALVEAGVPMSPALETPLRAIEAKMTPQGRWVMESSLNGKMWADVETKGKPSKWLTYFALRVLGHFGRG